jgi:hypothetical protein
MRYVSIQAFTATLHRESQRFISTLPPLLALALLPGMYTVRLQAGVEKGAVLCTALDQPELGWRLAINSQGVGRTCGQLGLARLGDQLWRLSRLPLCTL